MILPVFAVTYATANRRILNVEQQKAKIRTQGERQNAK
jgi:hypothetical protein